MARFRLGDRVQREAGDRPDYVRIGTITAVVPNSHGFELFREYEVDFGKNGVLIAFDNQLEPCQTRAT